MTDAPAFTIIAEHFVATRGDGEFAGYVSVLIEPVGIRINRIWLLPTANGVRVHFPQYAMLHQRKVAVRNGGPNITKPLGVPDPAKFAAFSNAVVAATEKAFPGALARAIECMAVPA